LNPNGFDGSGNYSIGIRDQLCFPEILYDEIDQLNGFDICIVTTARNDTEGYALLKSLGLPLLALD
jgi:large subunit ribosomal protein L5